MHTGNPPTRLSTPSKISGHVCSEDGAKVKSAEVTCHRIGTLTLADGSFNLKGLPPGTHTVTVSLQGFNPSSKTVTVKEGEEATLDFSLSRAVGTARIRGYVYDADTKKPLRHAGSVILVLPTANKYQHIDSDGYFEFEGLPEDTYNTYTSIPEYEDNTAVITVKDGETKTHNFFCKTQKTEEPPWG